MTLKLHHLRPAPGAKKAKTRVGRGEASKGKTSGRGTKGTKARGQVPAAFEGGQMPLHMRLPKLKGFKNPFKVEFQVVNLDRIGLLFPEGATSPSLSSWPAARSARVSRSRSSARARSTPRSPSPPTPSRRRRRRRSRPPAVRPPRSETTAPRITRRARRDPPGGARRRSPAPPTGRPQAVRLTAGRRRWRRPLSAWRKRTSCSARS